MTKLTMLLTGGALAVSAGFALAENHEAESMEGMDHSNMEMGEMDMSNMPEHFQALMMPMHQMMQDMVMESAGDVDADFLLMMIPHHQSAIDMARVVLDQGGDDEETRALAEEIIAAQEAEIAEMRAMLERMGVEPPAAE